ncbi:hypothetical protein J1N35_044142 [Gossypium stocksii]|uniref:RNase H type-1 domain-containing protein n=1 Tax=Gossypium stocksii TaxID=47602 RepID=A0A9D3U8X9_9ROSI|nr:hypothetical protein J1N35_044142 [Gossypium stocksii]
MEGHSNSNMDCQRSSIWKVNWNLKTPPKVWSFFVEIIWTGLEVPWASDCLGILKETLYNGCCNCERVSKRDMTNRRLWLRWVVDGLAKAEAEAVKMSLKTVVDKGFRKIIVEIDSKVLMDDINDGGEVSFRWKLLPILKNIWSFSKQVSNCRFKLIGRDANKATDWAAAQGRLMMCPCNWVNAPIIIGFHCG